MKTRRVMASRPGDPLAPIPKTMQAFTAWVVVDLDDGRAYPYTLAATRGECRRWYIQSRGMRNENVPTTWKDYEQQDRVRCIKVVVSEAV